MSKLAKSIAGFVLLAAMLGVGVWAAAFQDVNFSGKVYFNIFTAAVKIDCDVYQYDEHKTVGTRTFIDDYSYDAAIDGDTAPGWTIESIYFTDNKPVVVYSFTFTNDGENDIEIDIVTPTISEDNEDKLEFSGGLIDDETGVTDDTTVQLEPNDTAVFEFTLELTSFDAAINGYEEISFSVTIDALDS